MASKTHTLLRAVPSIRLGRERVKTIGAGMLDILSEYERFAHLVEDAGLSVEVLRELNDGLTSAFNRIDAVLDPVGDVAAAKVAA